MNLYNNSNNNRTSPFKGSFQSSTNGNNNNSNFQNGSNPFNNPSPNHTNRNMKHMNKTELAEFLTTELSLRDKKIENLEFEVKSMKNTLNLCITIINQMKSKPVEKQPIQSIFNNPKPPICLFNNPSSTLPSTNLFNNSLSSSSNNLQKTDSVKKNRPASDMLKSLCSSWTSKDGQYCFQGPDNFKVTLKSSDNSHNASGFILENRSGAIKFIDPVNLQKISHNINGWASIDNSNVGISELELKGKKCEVVIYGFCDYKSSNLEMKQNIVDRVSSLYNIPKFSGINFDYQTGKLSLFCSGF